MLTKKNKCAIEDASDSSNRWGAKPVRHGGAASKLPVRVMDRHGWPKAGSTMARAHESVRAPLSVAWDDDSPHTCLTSSTFEIVS